MTVARMLTQEEDGIPGYMAHPDWSAGLAAAVPSELWTPAIATPDGLRETGAWYRAQGWL